LSLGEHLKQRQLQKAALHQDLEEKVRDLQAQSNTAREEAEQAAVLYTKLQQMGGLLNLSPAEAYALMEVVRASDFTTDTAPMK
jgi:alkylation response protein AidB-like acyl-CoA dehydrogenase